MSEATRADGDRWSPLPVPPEPVGPPFGVAGADLAEATGLRGRLIITREHTIRGVHAVGRSVLLTVRAAGDPDRPVTVFVKQTDADGGEAAKHRHLMAAGAPVVPLLGVVETEVAPVIMTAGLGRIGIRADEADRLLEVTARFGAVTDAPEQLFAPPPGDPAHGGRVAEAVASLRASAGTDDGVDVDLWLRSYAVASAIVAETPRALVHHELAPHQVGWTAGPAGRSLVLLDLATAALLPRYGDLAGLLHPLAELTGRTDDDLITTYLDHLSRLTGAPVDRPTARRQIIAARLVDSLDSLPWWLGPDGPPDVPSPVALAARIRADVQVFRHDH